MLRPFYSVVSPFFFFFRYLNFIIIQTKNLYGISNKSNGVGVGRMYVTTCVTIKLQMNPVHLLQFLPNLRNWTSVNQLFQAQLAFLKRMEICQTLLFTNKLWKEHNFEYGPAQNYSQFDQYRSIRTPGLWVTEVVTYIRTTPLLLLLIPYMFLVIKPKMHHKTLKHPPPQSLVRTVTCAQNQWHCTNLKHLLQQSIALKINVEILKEKYFKISVLLQQLTYEVNDKIYFLQKRKKSASADALLQNQL